MPPPDVGPPLPRHQFPVAGRAAYLDTAHASPLPAVAAEALAADARDAGARGSLAIEDRYARLGGLRAMVAGLLGPSVSSDDVALVANTTQGFGLVAAGLDWGPGDVVLVPAADHPTTVLPWRAQEHRGVEVVRVPSDPPVTSSLLSALDATPGVRVVALSWVQAHDGERSDLAALAAAVHERGALLCVDVIQGVGVVPADLLAWGVDAAAGGAQKWLLGPHGIGALVVTPELRSRLHLVTASKASLASGVDGGPLAPIDSAARLEAGAPSLGAAAAWAASLELLGSAGVEAVWLWVDRLAARLADGSAAMGLTVVSPRSPVGARSALVTVAVPGIDPDDVVARLAAADVVASARGGGVRLSPAGWNDDADVDTALAVLASL